MGRILSSRSLVALMLGVALAAGLIAGTRAVVERKMRLERLEKARNFAAMMLADSARIAENQMEMDDDPEERRRLAAKARHHRAMERRIREARPEELGRVARESIAPTPDGP